MMELKLQTYKKLEFNLSRLVQIFSGIKLNNTAADYLNDMAVTLIDTETILRLHAKEKASKLSNYKEMLAVGVDISMIIPSCEETKEALNSVMQLVNTNIRGQYKDELKYISFDKKASKFVINAEGQKALVSSVVVLTGKAEKLYKTVEALYTQLKEIDNRAPINILPSNHQNFTSNIVNSVTGDLMPDNLVYQINEILK